MGSNELEVSPTDIAVIGMALRVPGAQNTRDFWANLRDGVESIRTFSPEDLKAADECPDRMRRKNYVPRGGDLTGMELFDADFFGFSPKEAAIMDPQHRHFLECAWEAMEDAARPPESLSGPVGVFAGSGMGSYFYFNVCSHRDLVNDVGMFLLRHTGNDKDFLATRVSYLFDLHGPSVNIQTACSTSLVAVHSACQSLLSRECEMALAGGVTIEFPHRRGYLHQPGEVLSPDGHCRAFDAKAAGTVFGSGVGVVVLRRLADAIADGDPIRAVIRATAVNNDGAGKAGYLAPSVSGQAAAIVEAHGLAGIAADSIQYVECHGTGTSLGDPIEIEALATAFRQSTERTGFCRVGSVKTNIGHLDTAAGVVSLIKTVLALEHRQMPPSLHFESRNPAIAFAKTPFIVNDKLTAWPRGSEPRRAAVNSLGVGGTNAHAIVEEAPTVAAGEPRADAGPQVIVLSAKSRKALDSAAERLAAHLAAEPTQTLQDVACTLVTGRRHFEHRRVVAVRDRNDAIVVLRTRDSPRHATHKRIDGRSGPVFLFPGGGAQYPAMAADLYRQEVAFASVVDEGLGYLPADAAAGIRRHWLAAARGDAEAARRLLSPSLQLPAILILEIALARLWMSWGITPVALLGHSMGENAAACIAGVMDFKSVVNLVHLRGVLFEELAGGAMLSVSLSSEMLAHRLPSELDIAVVNAPALTVVSGPGTAIDTFVKVLAAEGIDAVRVPISTAAHSRMLAPILERFENYLRSIPLSLPRIPIVSNVTGTWLTPAEATDPGYWVRHLHSTVRFADGLATLAADPARIYIEVGPGRGLSSLVKAQGQVDGNLVINSLPHADDASDDGLSFLTGLGRAWAVGLSVPLERLWADAGARRVALPTYPFQGQHYFLERLAAAGNAAADTALTKRADIARWGWRPVWKPAYADVAAGDSGGGEPESYLVFLDGTGIGASIAAKLRERGHRVVAVAPGDSFVTGADGTYLRCPEHGREGYDALVADLVQRGAVPSRIVHTWLVTENESHRPGSSFFHRNQERGFYSLFHLAQALGNVELSSPMQIVLLSNGMQRIGTEALEYPDKATVLGPVQVIPREMPGISVRSIDLPSLPPAERAGDGLRARELLPASLRHVMGLERDRSDEMVDLVWDDLVAPHGNEIVAIRNGRRYVRAHQEIALEGAGGTAPAFRQGGTYMITGGLGGIAVVCAEELARRFRAKLVIVGRLDLPDRAKWPAYLAAYGDRDRLGGAIRAIQRVEKAGGEVMYARADVTNPEAMRRVVVEARARFGAIHGVLHAAGVVKDELIALKTPSDVEDVFAPKVLGTMVLEEVLKDAPPELVVLFSSTSTDTAPAGQSDYVAANAYLNAYAESRSGRSGRRVVAVHWGVWNGVGMAARATGNARGDDAAAAVEPAVQPLFDRRGHDQDGDWAELQCEATRDWILNDHRLSSGQSVWPGTGYLELVAEAGREFGQEAGLHVEDLAFQRLLAVTDGQPVHVRVTHRAEGDQARLTVASRVAPNAPWQVHAEARLAPAKTRLRGLLDLMAIAARCGEAVGEAGAAAIASAQEQHLRFGPRWRVLRQARFGAGEALARLALDADLAGDIEAGFILHPGLMDIATGFAMRLIDGYSAADGLWVPVLYGSVRIHRALPAEIWSHVRLNTENPLGAGFATLDVTIADRDGRVLVEVERFTVKRLGDSASIALATSRSDAVTVRDAVTGGSGRFDMSPALERLAVQVEQGIDPDEGVEAMIRGLATGLPQVIISSLDLVVLQKLQDVVATATSSQVAFERPDIDADFVAPRNEIEAKLAGFWTELLGVQKVGINDSFFDLGGHSLVAVRLFRKIRSAFAIDIPISALIEASTIAQCAELIARLNPVASDQAGPAPVAVAESPRARFTHLVQMHKGGPKGATPFFICAGMFGNILNLRHLAAQIGQDRTVYGLQARGLYGDQAPHETFEEMASAYLAEVREVQPHGPYLLGGFSGGGLAAFEMAQQLGRMGDTVAQLVMLDTPYPETPILSSRDLIEMKLQDLRRDGGAFVANWIRRRLAWELDRRRKGHQAPSRANEQFHNVEIEAAFRRALTRYTGQPYGGPVINLRPALEVAYRVSGGRQLSAVRTLMRADNGWTPLLADLRIIEVPGNHDSMVLEPNVRVLAAIVRKELRPAVRSDGGGVLMAAD